MKKIILILLIISMMLQSFTVVLADSYLSDDKDVVFGANELFSYLDIIDNDIIADGVISRAEFASIISKILAVPGVEGTNEYIIDDV